CIGPRATVEREIGSAPLLLPLQRGILVCLIDEHRVLTDPHRSPRDGKNIYVLGARRIAEQRVPRGHDDDVRFDHRGYPTHSRGGVRPRGSTHAGDALTPAADVAKTPRCELMAMINHGYPAIWTARLVATTQMQLAAVEPVNVMLRVVYNTLDGIVNDYFVITASVAKR